VGPTNNEAHKALQSQRARLHYNSHTVALDNGDWCLRGDEFAFGDDIDNVIGKPRFAARALDRDRGALHSRVE
jgi:hypothetical protein